MLEPGRLHKGKIQSIEADTDANGCKYLARVLPATSPDAPTMPLVINYNLRAEAGNLSVGTDVIFTVFEDMTGAILARTDGYGGEVIPWDIEILRKGRRAHTVIDDVTVKTHRHTCPDGTTSPPID